MDLLLVVERTETTALSATDFADWKDAILAIIGRIDFISTVNLALAQAYGTDFSVVHWPGDDRTQEWSNIQRCVTYSLSCWRHCLGFCIAVREIRQLPLDSPWKGPAMRNFGEIDFHRWYWSVAATGVCWQNRVNASLFSQGQMTSACNVQMSRYDVAM